MSTASISDAFAPAMRGSVAENYAIPRDFDGFFRQVEKRAYRMALYAIRDDEAARDLVQDSMLKLMEKYADKPAEEWAPLFYTILNRRLVDWQRRRKVEQMLGLFLPWRKDPAEDNEEPEYVRVADGHPTPEGLLSGRQAALAIDQALATLPLRQRQAFMLRDWEGLSVKETATVMECSEGSVKTHHFRALAKLREQLKAFVDYERVGDSSGMDDTGPIGMGKEVSDDS